MKKTVYGMFKGVRCGNIVQGQRIVITAIHLCRYGAICSNRAKKSCNGTSYDVQGYDGSSICSYAITLENPPLDHILGLI